MGSEQPVQKFVHQGHGVPVDAGLSGLADDGHMLIAGGVRDQPEVRAGQFRPAGIQGAAAAGDLPVFAALEKQGRYAALEAPDADRSAYFPNRGRCPRRPGNPYERTMAKEKTPSIS